jgi:pimeloyl-ACP methyl ester carboxylesterase
MSTRAAREQFDWGATRDSVLALWSRFAGPALIVSGVGDQLCPPALQQRLAHANPRAHWDAFARCGHFIPLERPAALNASPRAWIATPAQATPDP